MLRLAVFGDDFEFGFVHGGSPLVGLLFDGGECDDVVDGVFAAESDR